MEKEIATVDRMLRLGASTEMVSRFYGLTHQEVALRREVLGLPKRKGRHPVLDEKQDVELWRRWKAITSSRNVDLETDLDSRRGHGPRRRHGFAVVGGLGRDQVVGRSGTGLSHGRGRYRATPWPRRTR
ncbi:hypothetical protein RLIN73S_05950 [Rhodanobacter lindaniclasticus]